MLLVMVFLIVAVIYVISKGNKGREEENNRIDRTVRNKSVEKNSNEDHEAKNSYTGKENNEKNQLHFVEEKRKANETVYEKSGVVKEQNKEKKMKSTPKEAKNRIKGEIGEEIVNNILSQLPEEEYFILHDILLDSDRGTVQIDHIVISIYGIFVIETKNHTGQIYGNEKKENWTMVTYGNRMGFNNPIWQNYGHIKAVENIVNLDNILIISIIAFSNDSELQSEYQNHVVNFKELYKTIRSYEKIIFTKGNIEFIKAIIEHENIIGEQARQEHIESIKNRKNSRLDKLKNGLCPKCGMDLERRESDHGLFFGCSRFPKCRYIISEKKYKESI